MLFLLVNDLCPPQNVDPASEKSRQPSSPVNWLPINHADLDDLALLEVIAADSDTGSDTASSDEEEDTRPVLDVIAIERHYWHRASVKYTYAYAHP